MAVKIKAAVVPGSKDFDQGSRDAALDDLRNTLLDNPLAARGTKLLTNETQGYSFTAGETKNIAHTLGRVFQGWFPVNLPGSTSYVVPRSLAASTAFPADLFIRCQMQNACTVYFVVF